MKCINFGEKFTEQLSEEESTHIKKCSSCRIDWEARCSELKIKNIYVDSSDYVEVDMSQLPSGQNIITESFMDKVDNVMERLARKNRVPARRGYPVNLDSEKYLRDKIEKLESIALSCLGLDSNENRVIAASAVGLFSDEEIVETPVNILSEKIQGKIHEKLSGSNECNDD